MLGQYFIHFLGINIGGVCPSWLSGNLQIIMEVIAIDAGPVKSSLAVVIFLCIPIPVVGEKASVCRQVCRVAKAQMPLADQPSGVPRCLEVAR